MSGAPEKATGELSHIRFSSSETGFLIGVFMGETDSFVALGNLLNPARGTQYTLWGKWVDDPKWGQQFRFQTYETHVPQSRSGIYQYLTRSTKWVGPATAMSLIEAYGERTLEVLREDPARVSSEIRGITLERAKQIQAKLNETREYEAALVKLMEILGDSGLRKSLPMDLVKRWGGSAPDRLADDPYCLMEFHGVGFLSADQVALTKFHVDPQHVNRQRHAIAYVLKEAFKAGHTWVPKEEAMTRAQQILGYRPQGGYQMGLTSKDFTEDGDWLTLTKIAQDESYIAYKTLVLRGILAEDGELEETKHPMLRNDGSVRRVVDMEA